MKQQRVALVTGASRGLGAHVAKRLARDGLTVAVNHRDTEHRARGVVTEIVDSGGMARAFAADVTDEDGVRELVRSIEDQLGSVDVVVANATGPQPGAPVEEVEWSAVLAQLNFFVKSPTLLLRAVLPAMIEKGAGRFIHVNSDVVSLVPSGSTAYVCAKTAQLALARSWAKELGPKGITVNTVSPGWIPVERHATTDPARFDAYRETLPHTRMGVPEDIAGAIAYLCSENAAFVNGANITVNGGKTVA